MSDWTAERLESLPEKTMIEVEENELFVRDGLGGWHLVGDDYYDTSAGIIANEYSSIRVVSVPVESLLDPKTVQIASRDPHGAAFDWFADRTLRRAVAHITGETNV